MNYSQKYQALKTELVNQTSVPQRFQLNQLITALDAEIVGKKKTHKQAFFSLLQAYTAFDLTEASEDPAKHALNIRLKNLDTDGNDILEHSSESDSQDGENKKAVILVSEDDDLFAFLCKNAAPLLSKKVFEGILHSFFSKQYDNEEAALKKTNWLLSVSLYQRLKQTKRIERKVLIQRILLGYLSAKTSNDEIDHMLGRIKEFTAYFMLDDIILYRMMDKTKQKSSTPHGPYQNTLLDAARELASGHQSHADLRLIRRYDSQFKLHSYRFIDSIKSLYFELNDEQKSQLKLFIRKLTHFDKEVRKLNLMFGLKGNPGGGLGIITARPTVENARLIDHITKAGDELIQEAHRLFARCVPGTISYHLLAAASFVLGISLVTLGVLSLALVPAAAAAALGTVSYYGLCASSIAAGYAFGLFSAPILNKARNCVETSRQITNSAINVIGHCKEAGVNASAKIDLSTPMPEEMEELLMGKIEDPTSRLRLSV